MVIIKNSNISVEISEYGAEIRRVTVNGEERFYNGNPQFWKGVAPILFPICGALKDDTFTVDGKSYTLPKHGFARNSVFEVERSEETRAVFLLKSDDETKKSYPWDFELRILFELDGMDIKIGCEVKNLSESTMYTAVGFHEAYLCSEGIEDYDIIFEKTETLKAHPVVGTLISRETETILENSNTLHLLNDYFTTDALVFTDIKSRFVTLKNRKTGKTVSVSFNGFDYFLIWTVPNAPFVCIEPWTTCPAFVDTKYDITKKEGMTPVSSGDTFRKEHTIHF